MQEARVLAEHLGCTEKECVDDAMALIMDNHQEMVQLSENDEIDDSFSDSEENKTICQWSSEAPKWKYPSWKYRVWNTSCAVIKEPPSPYPDGITTWKEKREWRNNNMQEWKEYRQKVRVARRNATYYMPYDQEKCNEVNGTKSRFYQVPFRYARVIEYKNCPQTYPDFPEPEPDTSDDNDTIDGNDTQTINVTGQINPVKHYTGYYDTGEVPSPKRYETST